MKIKKHFLLDPSYIPLVVSALLTILIVRSIYIQNQDILKKRLQERLVAIASTAAIQFDADEIAKIKGEQDLHSTELRNILNKMQKIRVVNKNLRYIYIWRKTDNPDYFEFVADAEMLEPIDENANGIIDEDEVPPAPGEKYATDQIPESNDLFDHALAQNDFIVDRWGTFLSGYAPIRDKNGKAVAVLGIDVEVGDFFKLIRATFIPFLILAVLLLLLLSIQTVALIRIWRSRVDVVQDLDRQKDELLGIVAHQLSKPITALRWNLESLLDGDLGTINEEQKKETISMRSQAVNLADLVSMILDVSRIQLGKIQLTPQPLNLADLFKEIVDVMNPTIIEKKISFIQKLPKKLPIALLDKRYTRMTIENLLSNAVKYTPEGGKVTLDVSMNNGMMRCSVADTGCGIPEAEKEKIFGKMFRASNVRNTVDGNGFGLYVAKGAIEAQGGTMSFTSVEGKGTTFTVELPIKEA